MFQLKLLRRPLPPKVERERLLPKKKKYKGAIEEDKEFKKISAIEDVQLAAPEKKQPIVLCFPDYDFGIQIPKRNFVIPLQTSGPPSFPIQNRRRPFRFRMPALRDRPYLDSDFILRGLAIFVTGLHLRVLPSEIRKPILSSHNYEILSSQLIAVERRGPEAISSIIFSYDDLPLVEQRKPTSLILLENMLKERSFLRDVEEEESSSEDEDEDEDEEGFQGEERDGFAADGETSFLAKKRKKKRVTYAESAEDIDFSATLISGVSYKPLSWEEEEENQLKEKAEMAKSFCLTHRRTGLSLKAYFLSQLPDLLPLADFLVYLNLSFNCLSSFPTVVFHLKHLEVLKLRNNPIKFIPEEISQMTNLKCLVMSFNLLTSLPAGLFALPSLESLDVSYNELETIPHDIEQLSDLTYLNIEGNFLTVLPCSVLKLDLKRLKLENNFLHPYFWDEICQLQPQRLTDLAAHCFAKHKLWKKHRHIPKDIEEILCNYRICDCCPGPLYGDGLHFIYPHKNVYGLRLPYLFCSCSPTCYKEYLSRAASQ
ncbi:leucine-rich repeat-containing protein 63 [Anolis carolinensis]|uniref:leucine-rich repeat-containing protein 63 n=1 Tax=Anolis carolinensis TaxID=28377 RepID=UPI00046289C9|nr:PREDICTED: leucine-rich repeat-containing protein 63 [Anolis carolinensis]|eukprot:XP_008113694.1 PREDICTED: leucine-rich repeat-containing protein 63 [Anolis carolinensis]